MWLRGSDEDHAKIIASFFHFTKASMQDEEPVALLQKSAFSAPHAIDLFGTEFLAQRKESKASGASCASEIPPRHDPMFVVFARKN